MERHASCRVLACRRRKAEQIARRKRTRSLLAEHHREVEAMIAARGWTVRALLNRLFESTELTAAWAIAEERVDFAARDYIICVAPDDCELRAAMQTCVEMWKKAAEEVAGPMPHVAR